MVKVSRFRCDISVGFPTSLIAVLCNPSFMSPPSHSQTTLTIPPLPPPPPLPIDLGTYLASLSLKQLRSRAQTLGVDYSKCTERKEVEDLSKYMAALSFMLSPTVPSVRNSLDHSHRHSHRHSQLSPRWRNVASRNLPPKRQKQPRPRSREVNPSRSQNHLLPSQ